MSRRIPTAPIGVHIGVEFEGDLTGPDTSGLAGAMRRAALAAGQYIQTAWIEAAVEVGFEPGSPYVQGLQSEEAVQILDERTDDDGAVFEVIVAVTNTSEHADIVEEGHVAFHLPSKVDWGNRSGRIKMTSDGRPYLHIPFSHAAYASPKKRAEGGMTLSTLKTMMPKSVYQQANKQARRVREGKGPQFNAKGQFVAADKYNWQGRGRKRMERGEVAPGVVAGAGGSEATHIERRSARFVGRSRQGKLHNPAWQSSKFEGLMKTGGPGHTEYLTVRTMTPDSPGWNIPAQAGYGIASRVAAELPRDPELQALVREAMLGELL